MIRELEFLHHWWYRCCLSYFSIVMKHQDNLQKKSFNGGLAYSFGRISPRWSWCGAWFQADRHGNWAVAESSHHICKLHTDRDWAYPSDSHPPTRPHLPSFLNSPPAGKQTFQYMSLPGAFSFKPPQTCFCIPHEYKVSSLFCFSVLFILYILHPSPSLGLHSMDLL